MNLSRKASLYHIDAYRLSKHQKDEYLEEYFDQGGVVIIEWVRI